MTCKEFQRTLHEIGTYDTEPGAFHYPLDRIFGQFDWWFHFSALGVYLRGCIAASFGKLNDDGWTESSYQFLRLYEGCGARVHVRDAVNLRTTPAVVIANHMSVAETLLLPAILMAFGRLTIVVKRSLTLYPFFGSILRASDPICVSRSNPREDLRAVLENGKKALDQGRSVMIFPQHTRNTIFSPDMFNSIGVKLASRAGVPLIPIALKTDFHGMGRVFKDMGSMDRSKEIRFCVGEPLNIDGNEKQVQRSVIDFISGKLLEWGEDAQGMEQK